MEYVREFSLPNQFTVAYCQGNVMIKVQVEYASSSVLEAYVEVAGSDYVNMLYQRVRGS